MRKKHNLTRTNSEAIEQPLVAGEHLAPACPAEQSVTTVIRLAHEKPQCAPTSFVLFLARAHGV